MAIIFLASTAIIFGSQTAHHGTVPTAVGASTEGTEARFGVPDSSIFATATTATSTGSVDSFHDSYTSLGGAGPLLDMMYGEVAPGGTGSGLYGMLILAVSASLSPGSWSGERPSIWARSWAAARSSSLRFTC